MNAVCQPESTIGAWMYFGAKPGYSAFQRSARLTKSVMDNSKLTAAFSLSIVLFLLINDSDKYACQMYHQWRGDYGTTLKYTIDVIDED